MDFDRVEFSTWYGEYERTVLTPGSPQIVRALDEMLNANFLGRARGRYRRGEPRVKSANRTFTKLSSEKYAGQVTTPSDAAHVLDDLLGLRIICTNLSDVFALRDALVEYFPLRTFAGTTGDGADSYAIEEGSLRNYISDDPGPKDSGYRAFHLNLMTQVAKPGGGWEVVRCEIQIRTHLQESWGELTHEDTYKPGGAVSELVETLSRRMAEVLAVMDGLAEDLRTELDRQIDESISVPVVDDTAAREGPAPAGREAEAARTPEVDDLRSAVSAFVAQRYSELRQPLPLASMAWELQAEFGSALLDGWLGYQKMALMLEEMLPSGAVAKTVPGMLVPRDFHAAEALTSGSARVKTKLPTGVPEVALALKAYDGSFPLLSSDEIGRACRYLAEAHTRIKADYVDRDPRYVNQLTKLARDLAQAEDADLSRGRLGYIATALRFGGWLSEDLTAQAIRRHYAEFVLNRFASLGLVSGGATPEAESVRRWLMGESTD